MKLILTLYIVSSRLVGEGLRLKLNGDLLETVILIGSCRSIIHTPATLLLRESELAFDLHRRPQLVRVVDFKFSFEYLMKRSVSAVCYSRVATSAT